MDDDESQLWHDFMLGIHNRAVRVVDDGWMSWKGAGEKVYGEKYTEISEKYSELLDED
jgi:hypothetical protein